MSTWYEFKGTLSFASEAVAAEAYATLRNTEDSLFWLPAGTEPLGKDLVLRGKTLSISDGNFSGGESFYTTQSLLGRIAATAVAGRVRCQDGDGEPGTSVSYYGFKPTRKAAKKSGKTTKKKAAKKTAAKQK